MAIKRFYQENTPYFITVVTENRKEIFKDKIAADLLIHILIHNKLKYDYHVMAFVIMPDHFHLIIQPKGKQNISEIMKRVKGSFSRYYNSLTGGSGSVLQKGFFDEAIRNEKQLHRKMEYIHGNPVRGGLSEGVDGYRYSSFRFYHAGDEDFVLLLRE